MLCTDIHKQEISRYSIYAILYNNAPYNHHKIMGPLPESLFQKNAAQYFFEELCEMV